MTTTKDAVDRWQKIVALCDERGHIPDAKCLRCGAKLQGAGEGRPAESYLGTYTGLCYPCTETPARVARIYPDGCKLWSYPPLNPSHRRNRDRIHAYDDCPVCKGSGFTQAYSHEPYRSFCSTCATRFDKHPIRRRMRAVWDAKFKWQNEQSVRFEKLERRPPDSWDGKAERARIQQRFQHFEEHEKRWRACFEARHADVINGIPFDEDNADGI